MLYNGCMGEDKGWFGVDNQGGLMQCIVYTIGQNLACKQLQGTFEFGCWAPTPKGVYLLWSEFEEYGTALGSLGWYGMGWGGVLYGYSTVALNWESQLAEFEQ